MGLTYRKIISCTNVNKTKSLGNYLFKTKCKWDKKVRVTQPPPPPTVAGSQNTKWEIWLRVEIVKEL
jgi:hypothetical protein